MSGGDSIDELVADVIAHGVRRVHVLAWRDLDDPDAGGSELHADEFMRRWAAAGLEIVHRTSAAAGLPPTARRHGYDVVRRGSRYTVFPRAAVAELAGRMGRSDALIEVWNGVPWFSPVWYRRPHMTILHHVHGPMWDQLMPPPLAGAGRLLEARLAPPFYRRTHTVTPSEATREELIELGFRPDLVTAVDNGVDPYFSPGGDRSPHPTVVAVGRLAPVKRFELLLEAIERARVEVPDLQRPHRRRGAAAPGSRAMDRRARRGRVGPAPRRRAARPAPRRVPPGVARGQRLAGRGLGPVADRGRGVRHARRGDRHPRPPLLGRRRAHRPARRARRPRPGDRRACSSDPDRRQRLAAAALARARTLTWDASALGVLRVFHRVVRMSHGAATADR